MLVNFTFFYLQFKEIIMEQQPNKLERLDISEEDQRTRLARQLIIVPGLAPPSGDHFIANIAFYLMLSLQSLFY
jgi:hypothetical protein